MALPTTLDIELSAAVNDLVSDIGKELTFIVEAKQFIPEDGELLVTSTQTFTKKTTPPAGYSKNLIDGQAVQRDDLEVGLPTRGLEFTPEIGMRCAFDGVSFRIVAINPVYSGEQVVMHMLQLRK